MRCVYSFRRQAPTVMRVLHIVILTLIVAYPDDVLSDRKARRTKGAVKKNDNGPCGKRFIRQINGKCYYLAQKKMNWFGAQNNCLRKGLNLADLSTADEFNAITNFLRSKGSMEDFWFGGNDLQSDGRFTYISNGRPVRYYGGSDGIQPTQRSNLDDCLEIQLRKNSTTVTNDNCQEAQYFICQQNDLKCAQPVMDLIPNIHHSHEHLHHFHHDAAKDEIAKKESTESLDSDSRPADNSISTEIGESPESSQSEDEEERQDVDIEDISEVEGQVKTMESRTSKATEATEATDEDGEDLTTTEGAIRSTDEEDATAAAEKDIAAPAEEETAAPAEGETAAPTEGETAAPTEGETAAPTEEETAAPTEGETAAPTEEETAAPTEGETAAPTEEETAAPTEGETAAPTEGETAAPTEVDPAASTKGETAASGEQTTVDSDDEVAAAGRAPNAEASDTLEEEDINARAPNATPVIFDFGAESTEKSNTSSLQNSPM